MPENNLRTKIKSKHPILQKMKIKMEKKELKLIDELQIFGVFFQ